MTAVPTAVEVSCPHTYAPAGATGPYYICRGCGSLVANPMHASHMAQGQQAPLLVARPEAVNKPPVNEKLRA